MPCGLPTRRYFQAIWCWKCPAGCQPEGTFKAFGPRSALRAANPQVLSSHLALEMPCGLPTRKYFQAIWCLQMPCRPPTRRYFQAFCCLKCPAGCQPAGTFKPFGARNALRAANPQVFSNHLVLKCPAGCQPTGIFKPFGPRNALRAANWQVLSRHLVLEMPCGLPSRRYFQAIWP